MFFPSQPLKHLATNFPISSVAIVLNLGMYLFLSHIPGFVSESLFILLPYSFHCDFAANTFFPTKSVYRFGVGLGVFILSAIASIYWISEIGFFTKAIMYIGIPLLLPFYCYEKDRKIIYIIWVRWLKALLILLSTFIAAVFTAQVIELNLEWVFYVNIFLIGPVYFLLGVQNFSGEMKLKNSHWFHKGAWAGLTIVSIGLSWAYTGYPWPYYQNNYYLAKFANQMSQFVLPAKTQFVGDECKAYGNTPFSFRKQGGFFVAQLIFSKLQAEEIVSYFKEMQLRTAYGELAYDSRRTYLQVVPISGFRFREPLEDAVVFENWGDKKVVVTYEQFGLAREYIEHPGNKDGKFYALIMVDGPYEANDIRCR